MEHVYDPPIHYQVCGKMNQNTLDNLTLFGTPKCVVAYDPLTKKIYPEWLYVIEQDNNVVILTPHLLKATSFKLQTNNRVFVFITNPTQQIKL